MIDYIINTASKVTEPGLAEKFKAALNIILVGSLASIVFRVCFYDYELLEITDFQGYYRFFTEGDFFLPFITFYILWYMTDIVGSMIGQLPNLKIEQYLKDKALKLNAKKLEIFENYNPKVKEGVGKFFGPPDNWFMDFFQLLNDSKDFNKIKKPSRISRERIRKEFVLIFRIFLLMTVYLCTLDSFNGWWYFLFLVLLIIAFFGTSFIYQLTEVGPVFFERMGQILKERSEAVVTPIVTTSQSN